VVNAPRDTARTGQITRAFAGLTDALVSEYDITELLQRLVDYYVALLRVSAAGLMLTDQRGALRLAVASDEKIETLELLQLQLGQGPCVECFREGRPVYGSDLARDGHGWPRFAAAAVDAGYRAVHALPLRLDRHVLGAMNLFYADPRDLSGEDAQVGQALANLATVGLLQHHPDRRGTTLSQQLEVALNARATIAQARGLLAETGGLTSEEAIDVLRGYARAHDRRLSELAADLVHRTLDAEVVLADASPS
jgi:transcriptional regulator with GAF, ATPase, and Fis domain